MKTRWHLNVTKAEKVKLTKLAEQVHPRPTAITRAVIRLRWRDFAR
jgi:hypothetical protein